MINEQINRKIIAVWNKHFNSRADAYAPSFYDEFKQGGLLFVGMNSSLNFPAFHAATRGTEYEKLDPETFLLWSTTAANPKSVDINAEISRRFLSTYRGFFGRMDEISNAAGLPYQHIDLFLCRQTSQKDFLALVRDKKGNLNEFGRDQLDIFHDAVAIIRPAVIIVSNAGSSAILRKEWAEKFYFDDEKGFHWLDLDGRNIPIFFSAMLSGGALDIGSYERLRWHVAQAVKRQPPPRMSVKIEL